MEKNLVFDCIFLFCLKLETSGTQVRVLLSVKVGAEPRINLLLTGKISLELDSNSS